MFVDVDSGGLVVDENAVEIVGAFANESEVEILYERIGVFVNSL